MKVYRHRIQQILNLEHLLVRNLFESASVVVWAFILEAQKTFVELTEKLEDLIEERIPLVQGSEAFRDQISSIYTLQDIPNPSSYPLYAVSPSIIIKLLETYPQAK